MDARMAREHLPRHVPRDFNDGFVSGTIFGQLGDQRVPVIVPAARHACFFRTLFQAVFSDPLGRAGSFGKRLPPGNTNQSGFTAPKCFVYQRT
jgi:hypothetical protein